MDQERRLKKLAEQLIQAIHQAYSDNDRIQETLNRIEEEGYQVDIFMASFTRIDDEAEDGISAIDPQELFSSDHFLYTGSDLEDSDVENDPEEEICADPPLLSPEINDFDKSFLKLIKVACP